MTISDHDHDHRTDSAGTRPTGRFVRTDTPHRGTTGGRHFPRNGLGEATDPVLPEATDASDGASDGPPHGSAPAPAPEAATTTPVLLPPDLAAQSARRLDRAMAGFVDDPGRAVREADEALDEAVRQLVENLDGRRTKLREAWQGSAGRTGGTGNTGSAGSTEDGSSRTEDLRLALRDYRDLLQHLLAV
ncbi:hypothetical protein [Kitasatospora phosalacinea]|uniref:Uncharacterized protein n=1 Tax=Kitasatospora phosalacinea TaxID=2065 RepID=A0ABW6GLN1_9ACTN